MPILKRDLHQKHKTHRNVLYSLVIALAILQIVSFTIISLQVSKLSTQLEVGLEQSAIEQKQFTTDLVDTYDSLYQKNFQEITNLLTKQKEDFTQEINTLKSSQEDFSGIIEDVVRGVVTVSTPNSLGSGFVVHSSGYIITNYHVIDDNEDNIRVVTYDRTVLEAVLVGKEELRDLALLRVDQSMDEIELANSNDLQVGKKVIAIGNPLGLSFTVTEGIVSGLNRVGPNGLAEYVQTDVSLNPGNSGGPLIDTEGKVIGINNFKIGGAEGLSFSLESNAIRNGVNTIANTTLIP